MKNSIKPLPQSTALCALVFMSLRILEVALAVCASVYLLVVAPYFCIIFPPIAGYFLSKQKDVRLGINEFGKVFSLLLLYVSPLFSIGCFYLMTHGKSTDTPIFAANLLALFVVFFSLPVFTLVITGVHEVRRHWSNLGATVFFTGMIGLIWLCYLYKGQGLNMLLVFALLTIALEWVYNKYWSQPGVFMLSSSLVGMLFLACFPFVNIQESWAISVNFAMIITSFIPTAFMVGVFAAFRSFYNYSYGECEFKAKRATRESGFDGYSN